MANPNSELAKLVDAGQRLENDIRRAHAEIDPQANRLVSIYEQAGQDTPMSDASNMETDEDLESLRQQVEAKRTVATAELAELRAVHHAEDRIHLAPVTIVNCPAREMSAYFSTWATARPAPTAKMPPAFVSACLGTTTQAPGTLRSEAPAQQSTENEQRRLREKEAMIDASRSVAQQKLQSLTRMIATATEAGHCRVTPAQNRTKNDLEEQMIAPIGGLPACTNGSHCVGMLELQWPEGCPPMPLKAMQNPTAFLSFIKTGAIQSEGLLAQGSGQCVVCILMTFCVAARISMAHNQPCASIDFPFGVVVARPGGFRSTAIFASDTMPVAWPDVRAEHFVSVQRTITRSVISHGRAMKTITENVIGFEFRSDVLHDPTTTTVGHEKYPLLSMRAPPVVSTQLVGDMRTPAALSSMMELGFQLECDRDKLLPVAIKALVCEFDATLRMAMTGDPAEQKETYKRYWNLCVIQAPPNVLCNVDDWLPNTHSVLAATFWRVGLALWADQRSEMQGNANLKEFSSAHLAAEKWLFDAWRRLGHPPSDTELLSEHIAVITPESACAALTKLAVYPLYCPAYLTPGQQVRNVSVQFKYHRRESSIDRVRKHNLPPSTRRGTLPREQARSSVAFIIKAWNTAKLSAPSSLDFSRAPLRSCSTTMATWAAQTISLIALQSEFEDSVWVLRMVLERWPWFSYLAAALTADTSVGPLNLDPPGSDCLTRGDWVGAKPQQEDCFRCPEIPSDAPPIIMDLPPLSQQQAVYTRHGTTPVRLADHLYPDAVANLDRKSAHAGNYLVMAALTLRVYELQRLAAKHDARLLAAFNAEKNRRSEEGQMASDQQHHPRRSLARQIQRAISLNAEDYDDDDEYDDVTSDSYMVDKITKESDVFDAAQVIAESWTDPTETIADALEHNIHLAESTTDDLLGVMLHKKKFDLYPDGKRPSMGPPANAPDREIGYHTRCALFECLELAYHANRINDISDAYWLCESNKSLRAIDLVGPSPGVVLCEDTLPDMSNYIGLGIINESGRDDFASMTAGRKSWVIRISSAMRKACYIRDWVENHTANCAHQEYLAWAAQTLLVSSLGTYRHACSTQKFSRALEIYVNIRPQNSHTAEGRSIIQTYLNQNAYKCLMSAREFQMLTILTSAPNRILMRAIWSNFAYVQEIWTPHQAELMRSFIAEFDTPEESERAVTEMARTEESADKDKAASIGRIPIPRVFRHRPGPWAQSMLTLFSRHEIDRQTNAVISGAAASEDGSTNSMPPIVNSIPPEEKHLMARFFMATDPREPIRLEWFHRLAISAKGLALLCFCNVLYTLQAKPQLIRGIIDQFDRTDFIRLWTAIDIMVRRRDLMVLPMPIGTARSQYTAMQYRVDDMKNPPPFTHMQFCHLLGCPTPLSFFAPEADANFYGADHNMIALDLGQVACGRQRNEDMYNKLERRSKESQVEELAKTVAGILIALEHTTDPDSRQQLEADLQHQLDRLQIHEAKNVRATIKVMMNRPCNEAPALELPVLGAMIVRRNSVHTRGRSTVYSACTNCGFPSIYSMDRYRPNGFMCGKCDHEVRWAEMGRWCISCSYVQQADSLPLLTGEAEAIARLQRSEHQIQGSTNRARSLKSHISSGRHEQQIKRQALQEPTVVTTNEDGTAVDTSDTLSVPPKSIPTENEVERSDSRPQKKASERRKSIAKSYRLGRTLAEVHPSALKTRMAPMTSRVVYDDRVGGTHTAMIVSLCRPCEARIVRSTVSLASLLEQMAREPEEIRIKGRRISLKSTTRTRRVPVRRKRVQKRTLKKAQVTEQDDKKRKVPL